MAYVLLYGTSWTQRWKIADGAVDQARAQVERVGSDGTGRLAVVDPATGEPVSLIVSWNQVGAAVILGGEHSETEDDPAGSYR